EVARALDVPHVRALAAREVREATAEAHQIAAPCRGPVVRHEGTTSVPIPLLVDRSTGTEGGTRPSIIDALSTPASAASRHACIFGIMPDSSLGSSSRSSLDVRCDTSESRFGQSAYRPATSVRITSFF